MTSNPTDFLRLRQICLVAQDLEPAVDTLCDVLGLQVCHRDPGVERFGLHNALMRIGNRFIEVVAPLPGPRGQNTAATRHLARLGGDGGYMVILDTNAMARWRAQAAGLGIREASFHQVEGYTGLQLHPRDTGGALLEINHTQGNDALAGGYWPAGPHWQDAPDSSAGVALQGASLSGPHARGLCQRWAALLQCRVVSPDCLQLDDGTTLAFESASASQPHGLTGLHLTVRDPAGIMTRARALGLPITEDRPAGSPTGGAAASTVGSTAASTLTCVEMCGVTWQLDSV